MPNIIKCTQSSLKRISNGPGQGVPSDKINCGFASETLPREDGIIRNKTRGMASCF